MKFVGKMNTHKMADKFANNQSQSDEETKFPLWRFVTILDKAVGGGGGNTVFSCNYYRDVFKGSYSRVRAHLLKNQKYGVKVCYKVSTECLAEMHQIEDESQEADQRKKPKLVPLLTGLSHIPTDGIIGTSQPFQKRKLTGGNHPLERALTINAKTI